VGVFDSDAARMSGTELDEWNSGSPEASMMENVLKAERS
jgi:hypothetical protein